MNKIKKFDKMYKELHSNVSNGIDNEVFKPALSSISNKYFYETEEIVKINIRSKVSLVMYTMKRNIRFLLHDE